MTYYKMKQKYGITQKKLWISIYLYSMALPLRKQEICYYIYLFDLSVVVLVGISVNAYFTLLYVCRLSAIWRKYVNDDTASWETMV